MKTAEGLAPGQVRHPKKKPPKPQPHGGGRAPAAPHHAAPHGGGRAPAPAGGGSGHTAAPAPSGGGRNARVVRTEAGSHRYGVAVGQPYTPGQVRQTADQRNSWGATEDPDVKRGQEMLVRLGLLQPRKDGSVHGNFGDKTKKAVQTFQRRNGLHVTGVLDKATLKRLTAVTPGGDPPNGRLPGGKTPPPTPAAAAGAKPRPGRPGRSGTGQGGRQNPPPTPPAAPAGGDAAKVQGLLAELSPAARQRVLARARQIIAARNAARATTVRNAGTL